MTEPAFTLTSDRRGFLARAIAMVGLPGVAITGVSRADAAAVAMESPQLQMLAEGYPRAFFWWTTCRQVFENAASPAEADRVLSQLQGLASPSIYLDYFSGFKSRHPEKLVFLFSQGYVFSEKPTVYDPIDRSRLFAGHWVHFEGCRLTKDIPAEEGVTDIGVEKPRLFRITSDKIEGRSNYADDICLSALGPDGRPDWRRSEQVKLVSVDAGRGTVRVRRGQYGTRPLEWMAGQTWIAAHASEAWGYQGGVSWVVNYSPFCPKDAQGRTAADILLDEFSALFVPGGPLARYDGLEFDVMPFAPTQALGKQGRGVDTDGDGRADGGYRDGVNVYGAGLYRFAESLRKRLGPDKLFMADGSPLAGHQRCFGVLNGIESEWWPQWGDMDVTHWSCGLNVHRFWARNSHAPPFGYFIHKIGGHDRKKFLSIPWSRHRLVMAAAQLAGAAFTSFYTPAPEPGQTVGLWDEMIQGRARKTGWLGQPLGPPVYLSRLAPDLLEGKGADWPDELVRCFQGSGATFAVEEAMKEEPGLDGPSRRLRIGSQGGAGSLEFELADVPCRQGQDLLISVRLKAEPRAAYPTAIPRHLKVEADAQGQPTLASFVNDRWFDACFYFRSLPSDRIRLRFTCEGSEPMWLSDLKVHAHPDAAYRLFENGLVLANPSDHPFNFDLASIQPARRYRRIRGSASQDPGTNDGSPVGESVTLTGRDGLFLVVEGDKS